MKKGFDLNCRERIKKNKVKKHLTSDKSETVSNLYMCNLMIYIDSFPNARKDNSIRNSIVQIKNIAHPNINRIASYHPNCIKIKRIVQT